MKMQQPSSIYFETYECSANQNNSEIMKGLVRQAGLDITNNKKIADVIVINTCIVKGPTEKKVERRIQDLKKLGKPLIVAGCMPEVGEDRLKDDNVYLLGINHVREITKLIKAIYTNKYNPDRFLSDNREEKICQPKISQNKSIGITQLSEGCNGACSYCVVKLAKGDLFSYPKEKIVKSVKNDLNHCKEIWLTSQDNASYGLDRGKRELPGLLGKVLSLKGEYRVRLGMMNPNNILPIFDKLIEQYKNEKLYSFLHLPLQSGSNKILRKMNRQYKREGFMKIVNKFREEIPDTTIATDIIVGYPGETEKDFNKSLEMIKRIRPDVLNVSRYWEKEGTEAAKKEQLPQEVRKERAKKMMKEFKEIIKEKNQELIGKEYEVLVNGKNGKWKARTDNYKLVEIDSKKELLGKFVNAKITGIKGNHLVGEIMGN